MRFLPAPAPGCVSLLPSHHVDLEMHSAIAATGGTTYLHMRFLPLLHPADAGLCLV